MASYTITPEITKTKKVVINTEYDQEFGLTEEEENLYIKYAEEQGITLSNNFWPSCDAKRDDPILVRVIEKLNNSNGLKIVEVRDQEGWNYKIKDYNGLESISEYFDSPDGKWRFEVYKKT